MGRFLRGRARTPPTLAHLRLRSRPAPSASSGRCQVGTSASRTHMSASLLRGRETVTHPTHHCARYCSNPSPSSATTPSVVASQILVDGPSTCHHPHATRMTACPPSTCVCSSMRCPSVKFRPHPTPRSSIQASVSYRRIPLPAASPVNRCQAALPPRRCVTLLHRSTAVKAATPPRYRRQAPGDKASRSASASSFLVDTACGPSSLQLPSLVPRRHRALARPCASCGHGQHPPCSAHHPDADVRTKFPPLACPSRCPLLPSLRSAPCERTLALPPRRAITSLSPCAGPCCFYALRSYKRGPSLCILFVPPPLPSSGEPSPPHCLCFPPLRRCQAASPHLPPRAQVLELRRAPELLPDQLK
jgi:hypothetical protein